MVKKNSWGKGGGEGGQGRRRGLGKERKKGRGKGRRKGKGDLRENFKTAGSKKKR